MTPSVYFPRIDHWADKLEAVAALDTPRHPRTERGRSARGADIATTQALTNIDQAVTVPQTQAQNRSPAFAPSRTSWSRISVAICAMTSAGGLSVFGYLVRLSLRRTVRTRFAPTGHRLTAFRRGAQAGSRAATPPSVAREPLTPPSTVSKSTRDGRAARKPHNRTPNPCPAVSVRSICVGLDF
jgi:hypothetical protein